MGIIKSGLIGPIRNKVGPANSRLHRNKNVVSAARIKSNKPATAKQLEEQAKFGLLNSFLNEIEPLLKQGFRKYAKSKTEINAAYKFNSPHAFLKTAEEISLNFSEIMYSKGRISTPDDPEISFAENQITFTWAEQGQYDSCRFTDLASFLIYNSNQERSIKLIGAAERYDGTYSIQIPESWLNDTLHCYMSFALADGKLVGDSIYVGTVNQPASSFINS